MAWPRAAPTILDFVGVPIPDYFDGRSFAPLLRGGEAYRAAAKTWDPRVFVQYFGESYYGGALRARLCRSCWSDPSAGMSPRGSSTTSASAASTSSNSAA